MREMMQLELKEVVRKFVRVFRKRTGSKKIPYRSKKLFNHNFQAKVYQLYEHSKKRKTKFSLKFLIYIIFTNITKNL